MVDMNKILSVLRLRDYLAGDPTSPMEGVKSKLQMENLLLTNLFKRRQLADPTPSEKQLVAQKLAREKEGRKEAWDKTKFMFTKLVDIMNDPKTSPADREHLGMLSQNFLFAQHPDFRAMLEPLAKGTPLDPMEQKLMAFDRQYPRPQSPMIRYEGGQPANINEENEREWAEYMLREGEWRFRRAVVGHGPEAAKAAFAPPKFVQPLPSVEGPGGERRPGNFWYINPKTRQVEAAPPILDIANLGKAKDWGWNIARIKREDFVPLAEPKTGDYGQGRLQITPGVDMMGNPKSHVDYYGKVSAEMKGVPKEWLGALYGMARGWDWEDDLKKKGISNEAGYVMKLLSEIKGAYKTKEEIQAAENRINSQINTMFPAMRNYRLLYEGEPGMVGKLLGALTRKLRIPGQPWSIIPATTAMIFQDSEGRQGTLYRNETTGEILDRNGTPIPSATNQPTGAVLPDVSFGPPPKELTIPKKGAKAPKPSPKMVQTLNRLKEHKPAELKKQLAAGYGLEVWERDALVNFIAKTDWIGLMKWIVNFPIEHRRKIFGAITGVAAGG